MDLRNADPKISFTNQFLPFLMDSTPVVSTVAGSSNDPELGGKTTEVSVSGNFPNCRKKKKR